MADDEPGWIDGGDEPRPDGGEEQHGADRHTLPGEDRVAQQLSSLFVTMLADEPPSEVTPLTVLRAAQREHSARHIRRAAVIRKWGGGLVAAAVVIVAAVLVGPMLTNRSATSADQGSMAASAPSASGQEAAADAAGSQAAGAGPNLSTSLPPGEEKRDAPQAGEAGDATEAASGPASGGSENEPGTVAGPAGPGAPAPAPAGGTVAEGSVAAGTGTRRPSSAGNTDNAAECPPPPLLPAARAAVVEALPVGALVNIGPVTDCRSGPGQQRGTVFFTQWPGSSVTVMTVSGARCDGCLSEQSPPTLTTVADRSVTATAGRAGVTVTAAANPQAAAHLTGDQLAGIVNAVLDATR